MIQHHKHNLKPLDNKDHMEEYKNHDIHKDNYKPIISNYYDDHDKYFRTIHGDSQHKNIPSESYASSESSLCKDSNIERRKRKHSNDNNFNDAKLRFSKSRSRSKSKIRKSYLNNLVNPESKEKTNVNQVPNFGQQKVDDIIILSNDNNKPSIPHTKLYTFSPINLFDNTPTCNPQDNTGLSSVKNTITLDSQKGISNNFSTKSSTPTPSNTNAKFDFITNVPKNQNRENEIVILEQDPSPHSSLEESNRYKTQPRTCINGLKLTSRDKPQIQNDNYHQIQSDNLYEEPTLDFIPALELPMNQTEPSKSNHDLSLIEISASNFNEMVDNNEVKRDKSPHRIKPNLYPQMISNLKKSSICLNDPRFSLTYSVLSHMNLNARLNLILDFDETILNSISDSKKFDSINAEMSLRYKTYNKYLHKIKVENTEVYSLFRPGIHQFLKTVSEYYNIYVYSHGQANYVLKLVDIIDPYKKYIKRDKIFLNNGNVNEITRKNLKLLNFSDDDIKKALIFDDLKIVWEESQQDRIILSKKFTPFKQYMNEKRRSQKYYITMIDAFDNNDSDLYEDSRLDFDGDCDDHHVDHNAMPLVRLGNSFKKIAQIYNCKAFGLGYTNQCLDIKNILKSTLQAILKNCNIKIFSIDKDRLILFHKICNHLGANIQTHNNILVITHVLIDKSKYLNYDYKEIIKDYQKKGAKILKIAWLIDSYFSLKKCSSKKYIYNM